MSLVLTALVAFVIGFTGSSAPEVTTAPVEVQQVQQGVQHDPILEADAAETLVDNNVAETFKDDEGNEYIAQYVDSDESSDNMFGEFNFESIDFPGTFHHYIYTPLKTT